MNEYMYNLDEIIKNDYNLDWIIKNSFKDTIEYLNNNGIKTGRLQLIIAKPPYLFFSRLLALLISLTLIYGFSFYEIISNMTYPTSLKTFSLSFSISTLPIASYYKKLIDQTSIGFYSPITREVYIKEKALRKNIDKILNNLSFMKIIRPSIIGLESDISKLTYPVYINGNNIKKDIAKAFIDIIVSHEIAHSLPYMDEWEPFLIKEWKASALELLIYFYKNAYHRYPEAYKIIEGNIRTCKDYVEDKNPLNIEEDYDLGRCYANIIIDKNKWSSKINIKDLIEEIKYLSEKDVINIIKSYNIN
ncbi:MAG: hypothetical protein L7H07_00855 [Candidatus Nanopusillus sp.]|nr:hypothetical protein [Candidatus Nanopusillus sp.]